MLFLSLSFFVMVGASVMTMVMVSLFYALRRDEAELWTWCGLDQRRFRMLCLVETFAAGAVAAVIGAAVVAPVLFHGIAWGLQTVWRVAGGGVSLVKTVALADIGIAALCGVVLNGIVFVMVRRDGWERELSPRWRWLRLTSLKSLSIINVSVRGREMRWAVIVLATGVMAAMAVGLSRMPINPKGDGGYRYYAETTLPVPKEAIPPDVVAMRKVDRSAADCFALTGVSAPSLLGMDLAEAPDFGYDWGQMKGRVHRREQQPCRRDSFQGGRGCTSTRTVFEYGHWENEPGERVRS
jgi:hypothetical protein